MAATGPDNVVNHRQAETGSFIFPLGSEEGFKDAALRIDIHADARVGDGEHHKISARQAEGSLRANDIGRDMTGLERKLSAAGHGIAGVDHQIHDDLLDLPGIGADAAVARHQA